MAVDADKERSRNAVAMATGVVFIVLGGIYLIDAAGWLDVSGKYLWPLALIVAGVAILVMSVRRSMRAT